MPVRNVDGASVRLAGLALLVLICLASAHASAAELPGGTLVVHRTAEAADCPDAAALIASTLELGTTLPPAAPAPLHLEVSFRREQSGYAAEVRASGRTEGVRDVTKEGATCAPLAEAVSVVLAVLLDLTPRATAPRPPAPPPPAPAPVAPGSASERPPPATPAGPSAPSESLAFGAGIQGGAAYRLVGDGLAPTVSAVVHVRLARWELFAGGLWAPGGSADYLEHTIEMSLLSAKLGGCAWLRPSRTRVDAALCASFLAGNLRAHGKGFPHDLPASDAWFAFGVGVAGRLPLVSKLALRLEISALVPTRKQTYTVAFTQGAYETSPVSALVELGPELTFP
jgi:hypothetical protein